MLSQGTCDFWWFGLGDPHLEGSLRELSQGSWHVLRARRLPIAPGSSHEKPLACCCVGVVGHSLGGLVNHTSIAAGKLGSRWKSRKKRSLLKSD